MSRNQIKVYPVEAALESLRSKGQDFVSIEAKKENKTYAKGSRFMNVRFNIGADAKREGWFSFRDFELSRGIEAKGAEDKEESQRLQVASTVSKTGQLGEFLMELNNQWQAIGEKFRGEKLQGFTALRKNKPLVQTHISESAPKNAGEPLEDPIVRFKLDFSKYPANYYHKFLAGKSKTVVLDYETKYTDENGKVQYKEATVANEDGVEEPVDASNVHLFLNEGAVIKIGRFSMSSVAIVTGQNSIPITLVYAVVQRGAPAGFIEADEEINLPDFVPTEENEVPELEQPATDAIDEDTIADVLNDV